MSTPMQGVFTQPRPKVASHHSYLSVSFGESRRSNSMSQRQTESVAGTLSDCMRVVSSTYQEIEPLLSSPHDAPLRMHSTRFLV